MGQVGREGGGAGGRDLPSTTSVMAAAHPAIARATTPIIKHRPFFPKNFGSFTEDTSTYSLFFFSVQITVNIII